MGFHLVCKVLDDKGLVGQPGLLEQRAGLQVAEQLLQPAVIAALRKLQVQTR